METEFPLVNILKLTLNGLKEKYLQKVRIAGACLIVCSFSRDKTVLEIASSLWQVFTAANLLTSRSLLFSVIASFYTKSIKWTHNAVRISLSLSLSYNNYVWLPVDYYNTYFTLCLYLCLVSQKRPVIQQWKSVRYSKLEHICFQNAFLAILFIYISMGLMFTHCEEGKFASVF
jgi:hypothetical protein